MKKILEIITQHFIFLTEEKNFRIVDSKSNGIYSARIILSSEVFFIRLVLEYDKLFMDLGNVSDYEEYCDSYWVRKIIGVEAKSEENKLPSVHAELLKDHFTEIEILFNKDNYRNTLARAKSLYHEKWS